MMNSLLFVFTWNEMMKHNVDNNPNPFAMIAIIETTPVARADLIRFHYIIFIKMDFQPFFLLLWNQFERQKQLWERQRHHERYDGRLADQDHN